MRRHALVLWVAVSLAGAACAPLLPSPTAATAVGAAQTSTLQATRTAAPSPLPTLPGTPQFIADIGLGNLAAVGRNPQALTVLEGRVYVANYQTDNVSVIEGGTVVAVIDVGDAPTDIAADAETSLVYVANEGTDSISIISGDRLVRTVAGPPGTACLAALHGQLYAGGHGGNELWVLNGVSGERLATVPLRASIGILALAINPASDLLYASVFDAVEIVELTEWSVVGRLEHEVYLTLGTDPTTGRLFVPEYAAGENVAYLVAYDARGQSVLGRVRVGGDPRGMAVDPAAGRLYVANSWSNDLSVIDSADLTVLANVPVGLRPVDVAVASDGQVYVTNAGSNNVGIVDGALQSLTKVVPLAMMPGAMAVQPDSGRLYVASPSTNSVWVVEDLQVKGELQAGLHPGDVALSDDGKTLAVLNYVSGDLWLVSTVDSTVEQQVMVGPLPQGLAYVPDEGEWLVQDAVLDSGGQRFLWHVELRDAYGALVKPTEVQVDPILQRAYCLASNGVPGSNSGTIVYPVDLRTGKLLEGRVGGLSMTGLALDGAGERIYSTAGRFGIYQLIVDDARTLQTVSALDLPGYPAALAYNDATHHIFICLLPTHDPDLAAGGELWVLDSRSLGSVTRIPLPGGTTILPVDSYTLAVDNQRGWVYLADASQGAVRVLQDVDLPPPPTPTTTPSPTPWPTATASALLQLAPTMDQALRVERVGSALMAGS